MTQESDLLAAIAQYPDDDQRRLLYADWLEENGDIRRAEFIRLQCLFTSGRCSAAGEERMCTLEDEFTLEWTAHLPHHEDVHWHFQRGFPEVLYIPVSLLLAEWSRWRTLKGIRKLELANTTSSLLGSFVSRSWSANWKTLEISEEPKPCLHDQFSDQSSGIRKLVECPQVSNLNALSLSFAWLSDETVEAICRSPHLASLKSLTVDAHYLGNEQLLAQFGARLQKWSLY